jgi:hypothetical protein
MSLNRNNDLLDAYLHTPTIRAVNIREKLADLDSEPTSIYSPTKLNRTSGCFRASGGWRS